MKPQDVMQVICDVYNTSKRSICVEGPPGGGKTSIIRLAAEKLGIQYTEIHMPTIPPEDLGIPIPDMNTMEHRHTRPHWFPQDPESKGILCFDDRNQAAADVQKVLANIMQARTLHGYALPEGWMVVSTGNRVQDQAGSNRILSHVRNRETVVTMESNIDDWFNWAVANNVRAEVIAFLKFKTDRFHPDDGVTEARDDNGAFPSPRSWTEGVSPMLGVVPRHCENEMFAGAVGPAAAHDFSAFLKVFRELPDMDDLIANPASAPVPKEVSTLYALSGSLAARCDKDNAFNIFTYLSRKEMPGEFAVLVGNMINGRDAKLLVAGGKAFAEYAKKHVGLVTG